MKQGKAKTPRSTASSRKPREEVSQRPAHDLTVIRKTFMEGGRWIERPKKTPIFICDCGNRYLKTRRGQRKCLTCIAYRR